METPTRIHAGAQGGKQRTRRHVPAMQKKGRVHLKTQIWQQGRSNPGSRVSQQRVLLAPKMLLWAAIHTGMRGSGSRGRVRRRQERQKWVQRKETRLQGARGSSRPAPHAAWAATGRSRGRARHQAVSHHTCKHGRQQGAEAQQGVPAQAGERGAAADASLCQHRLHGVRARAGASGCVGWQAMRHAARGSPGG